MQAARGLSHPEDHGSEHGDGNKGHHGFEQLLLLLWEFAACLIESDPEDEAQQHGQTCSRPDRRQQLPAPRLAQIARDDADDERGFDPFTQHDEKSDEHGDGWRAVSLGGGILFHV